MGINHRGAWSQWGTAVSDHAVYSIRDIEAGMCGGSGLPGSYNKTTEFRQITCLVWMTVRVAELKEIPTKLADGEWWSN